MKYFVGINQIKMNLSKFIDFYNINNEEEALNQFFNIIDKIQNKNENSVIQFISDKYILNQDHVFTACYYTQKAFPQNSNISNKKNIELLLYLATNRQINKSIEAFGINYYQFKNNTLTYCIISPFENINSISYELLTSLSAEETELILDNHQSHTKINLIKEFFEISDNQINSVLRSYGFIMKKSEFNIQSLTSALFDLICERMALLNVEKQK